jgi:hypothetical protein
LAEKLQKFSKKSKIDIYSVSQMTNSAQVAMDNQTDNDASALVLLFSGGQYTQKDFIHGLRRVPRDSRGGS